MSASTTPTLRPCLAIASGEVDGDRGLADAALAAGDREDLGQRAGLGERDLALRLAALQGLLEAGALLGGHHAEREVDVGDAGDRGRRRAVTSRLMVSFSGQPGDGQQHGDAHPARVVDVDGLDHAELGDRAA